MLYGFNFALTAAALGYEDLLADINSFDKNSNWTQLNPINFGGKNPDSIFSKVPYEKGFYFLAYLESLVGHNCMQVFLRAYFQLK